MIKHLEPRSVILVHGEKHKMDVMADVIRETLKIPCFYPANHEDLYINVVPEEKSYPIGLDEKLMGIDFSSGIRIPMIIKKNGDGTLGSNMKLAKEFFVDVLETQASKPVPNDTQAMQEENKTSHADSKVVCYKIVPHKISRRSTNAYR
jgi:hypothetical protein